MVENEKRLIDAYKLEDLLRSNSGRYHHKDDIIAAIAGQPTVDAVEVVHGHWIPIEYDGYADGNPVWDLWECSECQEDHSGDEDTLTPYCPYCGAKMDGERREGE